MDGFYCVIITLGYQALYYSYNLYFSKPISGLAVASWAHALVSTSSLEDTARVWDISSHQAIREVKLKGTLYLLGSDSGNLPVI